MQTRSALRARSAPNWERKLHKSVVPLHRARVSQLLAPLQDRIPFGVDMLCFVPCDLNVEVMKSRYALVPLAI